MSTVLVHYCWRYLGADLCSVSVSHLYVQLLLGRLPARDLHTLATRLGDASMVCSALAPPLPLRLPIVNISKSINYKFRRGEGPRKYWVLSLAAWASPGCESCGAS